MTADSQLSLEAFEKARPRLWGLVYRMLGSAADAELWTDGGGKAVAQTEVIRSPDEIARVLHMIWEAAWHQREFIAADVNGAPGLILREDGETVGVLTLAAAGNNRIAGIYIVRYPDRLVRSLAET